MVHSGTRLSRTDDDATFDAEIHVDASNLAPFVTWGTNPGQGVPPGGVAPAVEDFEDEVARSAAFGVHGFDPDEIGSRFADIFRNNSANNGLLLAQVDPEVVEELWDFAEQHPGEQLTVSSRIGRSTFRVARPTRSILMTSRVSVCWPVLTPSVRP